MKFSTNFFNCLMTTILLVILLSCQNQKTPEISPEIRGSTELSRLEACTRVNFTKGVLLYKNTLDLFLCTKWDEQFPNMYKAIKTVSADSWDHLMAPLDRVFIENQTRRDRFFQNIRELDSKGGLDDLSYVIVALNETNFFDSTKTMFACVEQSDNPICESRKGRIPKKASLKNIIKIIDSEPETIDNFSAFLKFFSQALSGHQEQLRFEINKFKNSPLYIPLRLNLVDSIAKKMKQGFSIEDREFLSKILLTGNGTGDAPWIYDWIQSEKMNRDKFRDLIQYPALTNPEFFEEIKNLEKAYNAGIRCNIKMNGQSNELIEFDFKTHLFDFSTVIKERSYKGFYDFSSADIFSLKMSTEVCRELEHNNFNVNFIKLITHFSGFLNEKSFYDLTKFLITQTKISGDFNKNFDENLYLFGTVAGNILNSGNALNTNILSSTREFYPTVFDVMKSMDPDSYVRLGEFINSSLKESNDSRYVGVSDFWNFFTSEEKNFVFNFVDRHFDKNIKFVLLFDFYNKFFDEIRDVQPILSDSWAGSEQKLEQSYLTLEDLFSKLAGKETLLDFKKFFSRNQILSVLEIISNGKKIADSAKQEIEYINSDNYVYRSRSERYRFRVKYNPSVDSDYNAKEIVECMEKFSDIQNGFYELVKHLPVACSKVNTANISFQMFSWLNSIEENYSKFLPASNLGDNIFDEKGILSPYMLNTSLGSLKILDGLMSKVSDELPGKGGIEYLLNSANYYLNMRGALALVDKDLDWANQTLNLKEEENKFHRNSLLKMVSKNENFDYLKSFFIHLSDLFIDYGNWIKSGEYLKAQNRNLGTYDPNSDCKKVINQFITPYPCPSKEIIKLYGNDILLLLQNVWEKEQGSPVGHLLKAFKVGEGIDIPLGSKVTSKSRISLSDIFRYMYDTSDKTLSVNKQQVKFVNENGKNSIETVTTLERVETVIREVRFGNNYLGVSFLNSIVHGDNYNADVLARKKLLEKCVHIPKIRCARTMSENDLRMALNSLEVYDSLLDVNNGRGLDAKLQFGEFLKTFETTLVASSALEAQKVQLTPLSDDVLVKHNGKILSDMTVITTWSNIGRIIRDRIGRTRTEFEAFINREDFKRVDRALLYGFELPEAKAAAEKLILKFRNVPKNETENLFGHTVNWINTLSYDEIRLVEDTLSRMMVVGSYLGTPEIVFGKNNFRYLNQKYQSNNLYQLFISLERIIEYWPLCKKVFPRESKLISLFKPVNNLLYFLTKNLQSTNNPEKNTAYLALNDLFLFVQTAVLDRIPRGGFGAKLAEDTQGLNVLLEGLKNEKYVNNSYELITANYKYLDVFHERSGEWFLTVGQNVKRAVMASALDLSPIRDYLEFTSKNYVCLSGDSKCSLNYHYDEPMNLVKYLNVKSDAGQSNFDLLNQKIFIQNIDQISQLINDLLPSLKIKEVKPILNLN